MGLALKSDSLVSRSGMEVSRTGFGLGLGLGCPCLGLGLGLRGPGFVYRVSRPRPASRPNLDGLGLGLGHQCLGLGLGGPGLDYNPDWDGYLALHRQMPEALS